MKALNFALLTTCLALSACGQPGPLYLPPNKPPFYVEPESETEPDSTPKSKEDEKKSAPASTTQPDNKQPTPSQ